MVNQIDFNGPIHEKDNVTVPTRGLSHESEWVGDAPKQVADQKPSLGTRRSTGRSSQFLHPASAHAKTLSHHASGE